MNKINTAFYKFELIGLILFKILLDFSYKSFVSKYYDYSVFILDFNNHKYIEGWIVYVPLIFLLSKKRDTVLYITLLISFLLLIVPTITLYAYRNEQSIFFYTIIFSFILILLLIREKSIEINYIKGSKNFVLFISIFFTLIVFLHYLYTVGRSNLNFDFSEVYVLREKYGEINDDGVFGYLNPWVTKLFNLLLIIWAMHKKKYLKLFIFIGFQIAFFGFSGNKVVLLSLLLIGMLYALGNTKYIYGYIIFSFVTLISLVLTYAHFSENLMLPSIVIRRAFFLPASLNYTYYDFFSNNEFVYWSNSVLKLFIENPYKVETSHVIGDYLGHPEMGANTGVFGAGYMHFGIVGVLIYVLILSYFINLINQFRNIPIWIINGIILIPTLTLFISSDLPTSMLTHGFLLAVLVLYLYSEPKEH